MFVGDLCMALGVTLATVEAMSAAEFAFWVEYHRARGFPFERTEAATAIGAAYVGRMWGGTREPQDLLPKFGARPTDMRLLAAQLSALPGAKVRRIPRPERRAARERERANQGEPPNRTASRVLNPKK